MNAPTTLSKPAAIRRTRYAIQTAALLFAITTCCVLVGILGDRFPRRFDATVTREHQLSERTQKLLKSLDGDYELIIAANFSMLDPQAARRTQDVLDNFSHATTHLRPTVIDAASANGAAQLDAILARLVDRFKPELDKQREGLNQSAAAAAKLVAELTSLSDTMHALDANVLPGEPHAEALKRLLADCSTNCAIASKNLEKAVAGASQSATLRIGHTPVPGTDELIANLRGALSSG
ncbi:MAG TPA: hypothetical protein VHC70_01280, partial [Phycisphaerales bacterium]|nr:hypothetical protein [Phycisphaerales bacterium]